MAKALAKRLPSMFEGVDEGKREDAIEKHAKEFSGVVDKVDPKGTVKVVFDDDENVSDFIDAVGHEGIDVPASAVKKSGKKWTVTIKG